MGDDVGDAAFVDGLLGDATDVSIFHMGAVMSGGERWKFETSSA